MNVEGPLGGGCQGNVRRNGEISVAHGDSERGIEHHSRVIVHSVGVGRVVVDERFDKTVSVARDLVTAYLHNYVGECVQTIFGKVARGSQGGAVVKHLVFGSVSAGEGGTQAASAVEERLSVEEGAVCRNKFGHQRAGGVGEREGAGAGVREGVRRVAVHHFGEVEVGGGSLARQEKDIGAVGGGTPVGVRAVVVVGGVADNQEVVVVVDKHVVVCGHNSNIGGAEAGISVVSR